jgi:hypothetical protein
MYLITTTQRCGSTWLSRILQEIEQESLAKVAPINPGDCRSRYINGTRLGFSLVRPTPEQAFTRFSSQVTKHAIKVSGRRWGTFKTHDIPSKDFDKLAEAIPDLRIVTVQRDFKDVIVSRFFYCRYYWPTEPGLGEMSPRISEPLSEVAGLADAAALRKLIDGKLYRMWAREWAAFEVPFATPSALRVSYEGMLDGSAGRSLEEFVGRPLPSVDPFRMEQTQETLKSGRVGKARFNRQGTSGQWLSWFTPKEAARLDAMAARALAKQEQGPQTNLEIESPTEARQCS